MRGVWKEDQGQEESREGGIRLVEANPGREKKEEPEMGSGEKERKENDPSRPGDQDQGEPPTMEEEKLFGRRPSMSRGTSMGKR